MFEIQGLYSQSGHTLYRKISRREISQPRSGLDFSIRSEIWQVPRSSPVEMPVKFPSERCDHCNTQSHSFETSRDLAVRRLTT